MLAWLVLVMLGSRSVLPAPQYGPAPRPAPTAQPAPAHPALSMWWMGQQGAFGGGDPAPSPVSPNNPVDPASLPVTECARGWKCVSSLFCDGKGVMVAGRVELSPAEEAARGPLSVGATPLLLL